MASNVESGVHENFLDLHNPGQAEEEDLESQRGCSLRLRLGRRSQNLGKSIDRQQ